jgi:hypothetical protein
MSGKFSRRKCLIVLSVLLITIIPLNVLCSEELLSPDGKGSRSDTNGWIFLHIEGSPYEMGFRHGQGTT